MFKVLKKEASAPAKTAAALAHDVEAKIRRVQKLETKNCALELSIALIWEDDSRRNH